MVCGVNKIAVRTMMPRAIINVALWLIARINGIGNEKIKLLLRYVEEQPPVKRGQLTAHGRPFQPRTLKRQRHVPEPRARAIAKRMPALRHKHPILIIYTICAPVYHDVALAVTEGDP